MNEKIEHTSSQRMRFVFSYGEHEVWLSQDDTQAGEDEQAFIRFAREQVWEQQGDVADDLSCCDPDVQSIGDLIDLARECIGDGDSDELVQIPFEKLAELMAQGGWSFVGGSFMEFEGNHNDTEIEVVLERKAPEA